MIFQPIHTHSCNCHSICLWHVSWYAWLKSLMSSLPPSSLMNGDPQFFCFCYSEAIQFSKFLLYKQVVESRQNSVFNCFVMQLRTEDPRLSSLLYISVLAQNSPFWTLSLVLSLMPGTKLDTQILNERIGHIIFITDSICCPFYITSQSTFHGKKGAEKWRW